MQKKSVRVDTDEFLPLHLIYELPPASSDLRIVQLLYELAPASSDL